MGGKHSERYILGLLGNLGVLATLVNFPEPFVLIKSVAVY